MRIPPGTSALVATLLGAGSSAFAADLGLASMRGAEPVQPAPVVTVQFAHGGSVFRPGPEARELLAGARDAAVIYISGRTSSTYPTPGDDALAVRRALAARQYLISQGISPLKIMINAASATDYRSDNSTPEGRQENQRVDIEVLFVSAGDQSPPALPAESVAP